MREFLPAPPKGLTDVFEPLGEFLGLPLLSKHMHEILFFLIIYHLIYTSISPSISTRFFPKVYPTLSAKAKIDWDVDAVSLTQCTLIGTLTAICLIFDQERREMTWKERVWGYTGATNTLLGIANGYFVWHFLAMIKHFRIYGWSMVAHGICALAIMMSGFRPALNCYAPVGLLYELSNIPLNLHRFMIKLGMEGSRAQLINGIFLVVTFLSVRIIYGSYTMYWLFSDIYRAVTETTYEPMVYSTGGKAWQLKTPLQLPMWIVVMHLLAETTIFVLNYVWFYKMVNLLLRRIARSNAKASVKGIMNNSANNAGDAKLKISLIHKVGGNINDAQIQHALIRAKVKGLIHLNELPAPWRINPHIISGYRFTSSVRACCRSAFRWSNESINIWSHLTPLLVILLLPTKFSVVGWDSQPSSHMDVYIQIGYIFAIAVCLACSSSWHTMKCISHEHLLWKFASVDMMGVSILISANSIMTEYTGLDCCPTKRLHYMLATSVCGLVCMILPWQEWVRRPSAAWIRVGLFTLLGASGLVPAIDMAVNLGFSHAVQNYKGLVLGVVLPVLSGAIVYGSKFPEAWWPGRFDFIGSSHNLWHMAVLAAMWGGFTAMRELFVDLRLKGPDTSIN
ncbi:putative TLC domain-containing [Hyphodiscus hymeniophilus]|uniref:TLC domain-containing n=1 Tax=Hyphodiscus hymeniophilus TaxID=353542 RepID=A0A9P6VED5_9HELO|nr:putative TLC domain-containing [Hyphodiscus hymeniophilus]